MLAASREWYTEHALQEKILKKTGWTHDRVFVKENYALSPSFQEEAMAGIGLSDCPHIETTSTFQEAAHLCATRKGLSVLPESLFHKLTSNQDPRKRRSELLQKPQYIQASKKNIVLRISIKTVCRIMHVRTAVLTSHNLYTDHIRSETERC